MAEKESFVDRLKRLSKSASALKAAAKQADQFLRDLIRGKSVVSSETEEQPKKLTDPVLPKAVTDKKEIKKPEKPKKISKIEPNHIGKLIFFDYDPKWKKKLPYYDRFPLVIPISISSDRFIGLNLHYLPPGYRAVLFDALSRNLYRKKNITEDEIIKLNYSMLSGLSKSKLYIPCVRQYLYSHVEDKYTLLPYSEWKKVVVSSTPKFEKKSKEYIWKDSFRKINKY